MLSPGRHLGKDGKMKFTGRKKELKQSGRLASHQGFWESRVVGIQSRSKARAREVEGHRGQRERERDLDKTEREGGVWDLLLGGLGCSDLECSGLRLIFRAIRFQLLRCFAWDKSRLLGACRARV